MRLALRENPPAEDHVAEGIAAVLAGSYDLPAPEQVTFDHTAFILDIGAHVGSFSVWATHRWPNAFVMAYEPHPQSAALCRRNLKGLWAEVFECGVVGERSKDKKLLYEGKNNTGQRSFYDLGEQRTSAHVQVHTIRANRLPAVDILKLDTEGCEVEILQDYSHLKECRIVMVEWHTAEDCETIQTMMTKHLGFRLVRDDAAGRMVADRNLVFVR